MVLYQASRTEERSPSALCLGAHASISGFRLAFRMAFAQGVAIVLECGWIFLQLLSLVLPINT